MDPMGICLKLQKLVAEMFEPKKQDESSIFGHSIFFQTKKRKWGLFSSTATVVVPIPNDGLWQWRKQEEN